MQRPGQHVVFVKLVDTPPLCCICSGLARCLHLPLSVYPRAGDPYTLSTEAELRQPGGKLRPAAE